MTITRTNPATGRVTRTAATILAVGEGVVLQTVDGNEALYCSGLPERLELARLPDELLAKPRLSVKLAAGEPGPRTVKVSYLAHGFAWSSDYVAHLNERSDAMSLAGWATLTNSTGTVFEQAEVQLVAGRLNILAAEEGGSAAEPVYADDDESDVEARERIAAARRPRPRSRCCATASRPTCRSQRGRVQQFLMQSSADARDADAHAARARGDHGTAAASSARSSATISSTACRGARISTRGRRSRCCSSTSPRFASSVSTAFASRASREPPAEDVVIPNLIVALREHGGATGLGEPLPSGVVRVFESYGGRDVLAGEAEIGDRPVGLPVELVIGRAQNVCSR